MRQLHVARAPVVAAALILLVTAACTTPSPAPPRTETLPTYRIGPPDSLNVSVLPEPAIERTVTVRPDGMITLDLIGDVPAAGRTTDEIAEDIQLRISRFKRGATVSVSVALARSTNITVLGEVRAPSAFPLQGDTRLIEAIGRQGGTTEFGAETRVRVIRSRGGKVTVFNANLKDIQSGDLSSNILLERGDIVIVPRTRLAQVGFAIQSLLFPFQQIFGLGRTVGTTVITGGAGAGF